MFSSLLEIHFRSCHSSHFQSMSDYEVFMALTPERARALDIVLPLLKKVAARDARGNPCVGRCGMGGSGSFFQR